MANIFYFSLVLLVFWGICWVNIERAINYERGTIMEKEETYKIETYCTNCGSGATVGFCVGSFEIPKGQWVEQFLGPKICENCGCQGCLKRWKGTK